MFAADLLKDKVVVITGAGAAWEDRTVSSLKFKFTGMVTATLAVPGNVFFCWSCRSSD